MSVDLCQDPPNEQLFERSIPGSLTAPVHAMGPSYKSPDPSPSSWLGERPELQLDYDILNNTRNLPGYLNALDFTSDFTLIDAGVDSTPESWPEMNVFPDLNRPPYTGASFETDLPPGVDISQDTGNYQDPHSFGGFDGGVEILATLEISPPVLKHPCAYCPRSFRREGDWRKHLRIHTRPIQCPVLGCNGAFAHQRDCDRHVEAKHKSAATKRDWLTCWACPRSFARKDALKRHLARVHNVHVSLRSKAGSLPTTSCSNQSETSLGTTLSYR